MTLTEELVPLYAETLVKQVRAGGYELDYSPDSLGVLDVLLAGSDPLYDLSGEAQRGLVTFYAGCYLGEVIVRGLGGRWQLGATWLDATVVVEGGQGGILLRPFDKLEQRLREGEEGNLLTAYYQGLVEHRENHLDML